MSGSKTRTSRFWFFLLIRYRCGASVNKRRASKTDQWDVETNWAACLYNRTRHSHYSIHLMSYCQQVHCVLYSWFIIRCLLFTVTHCLILNEKWSSSRDAPPGVLGESGNSKLSLHYESHSLKVSIQVLIELPLKIYKKAWKITGFWVFFQSLFN